MKADILRFDHEGRGISYVDGKITFVEKALPGETVEIDIKSEKAKYKEAIITTLIKESPKRVKSDCPYFSLCGGCALRHMSYDDTIEFKREKVVEILQKYAGVKINPNLISCPKRNNYRNKIEIKVHDGIWGFYKSDSHDVLKIMECLNAEDAINDIIKDYDKFHLNDGEVIIKANYNGEVIISIKTLEKCKIDIEALKETHKLVGVILNDKVIYGEDSFIEIVDGLLFKESYNSFFQVNRHMNLELFNLEFHKVA